MEAIALPDIDARPTEAWVPYRRRSKSDLPPGWNFCYETVGHAPQLHADILNSLVLGKSATEIQEECGVSYSTVMKVKSHVPYVEWLEEQRSLVFQKQHEAIRKLHGAHLDVVTRLLGIINDPTAKNSEVLSAIKMYHEIVDIGKVHRGVDLVEEDRSAGAKHLERDRMTELLGDASL